MKITFILIPCCLLFVILTICNTGCGQSSDRILPLYKVTLNEAHIGDLEIDTKLLDSYELLPNNIRQFYLDVRAVFFNSKDVDFTNSEVLTIAKRNSILLMGGPLLGNLNEDGIVIWLRPSTSTPIVIKVTQSDGDDEKLYRKDPVEPGVDQRLVIDGLISNTDYHYAIFMEEQKIAQGSFKTAPYPDEESHFRLVFGSCFHKIGLHNPNLINQIIKRNPQAMALLGDIAVDDRENNISIHRADYLLRDVSEPWRQLAANVPLYTSWDDHDYFNDDLGGIPNGFTEEDRDAVREVWFQNWNNPENPNPGIYFNTRIGPVELIMLDTRSLRENQRRGEYGSYLGIEQLNWLKEALKNSEAPFKVISSGTMWSDYISGGKDSWGTWDTLARQEIFNLIEVENISGVLLISGDRHGARGFSITRPSGFMLYEFEVASLSGVPGPEAMAKDAANQIFGYHGADVIAFGEFTFDAKKDNPLVVFRLIDEFGSVIEEHSFTYSQLTPK